MTCRHCGEDLNKLQPRTGIFRHQVGLCAPSHNEVEAVIAELEIEDEREKQVIRRYWDLQREQRLAGKPEVHQSRPVWSWLKDRWMWLRWMTWQ